jgi:hypothetical protein
MKARLAGLGLIGCGIVAAVLFVYLPVVVPNGTGDSRRLAAATGMAAGPDPPEARSPARRRRSLNGNLYLGDQPPRAVTIRSTYVDQSHFIKDIKSFSGYMPTRLVQTVRAGTSLPCALILAQTH